MLAVCICVVLVFSIESRSLLSRRGVSFTSCGKQSYKPTISKRILSGTEAIAHSWPWIVSLQINGKQQCGGSLLDSQHVLTAAHCFTNLSLAAYSVVAGLHRLSWVYGEELQSRPIFQLYRHEQYSPKPPYPNDIAVVRVSEPFFFDRYVSAICLPGPQAREGRVE